MENVKLPSINLISRHVFFINKFYSKQLKSSVVVFAGIGYETAKYIAMMGAKVILACRDQQKANEV